MLTTEITASNSELVTIRGGSAVTTTLAIAAGTKVTHEAVIKLVRTYRADLEEFGLVRFEIGARSSGQHGGGDVEYAMLNEEQSALLLSYMRNNDIVRQFKKSLIREFYAMRAKLNAAPAPAPVDLNDPATLRSLLLGYSEKVVTLEAKVSADAPKVAFAEAIRAVDGVCNIEKIAKTIGIGRNKLFRRLRDDGILMSNNLPYQRYIEREYFTVIEQEPFVDSKGVTHPTFTTMVTGAGQLFLAKKYANIMGAA
jgi:anti-repressor protein